VALTGALLGAPQGVEAQAPAQRQPARQTARPKPSMSSGAEQPRFKGIFEPISYPEDLKFTDVFFVNRDMGWAVGGTARGAGGMVLYTSDGGDHWSVNLGDPQSNAAAYSELRFIDARHGWMAQGNDQLLRTVDGQNWEVVGKIPDYYYDYLFTSPTTGVMSSSGRIQRTVDGGRTWNPVFTCRISLQTNGLTQDVECTPQSLHFPNAQVGYFVAYYGSSTILGKTLDGGETWRVSLVLPEEGGKEGEVFFLDENTGFLLIGNGNVYATGDGGQSWHQLPGVYIGGRPQMKFADPQVGWSIIYRTMAFTTDGRRWTSRDIGFPANVNAFSLPSRDRGYVVGNHGMIYRYRVVRATYTSKGMIDAPLMPGVDSPLEAQMEQLATQVQEMAKVAGVPLVSTADVSASQSQANSAAGGSGMNPAGGGSTFVQGTGAPVDSGADTNAAAGATPSASSTGATGGGFTQDVGLSSAAANAFVQDVGQAQTTLNTVTTQVPQFVGKYKNLNLLLVGFQTAVQLPAQLQTLKQSFQNLKTIHDPQTFTAAVTDIQTKTMGILQMVRMAFQKR